MVTLLKSLIAFGDTHFPHEDEVLIDKIHGLTKKQKFDYIIHVGDVFDFQKLGRFRFDPQNTDHLMIEINRGRQFFQTLRKNNPKSRIVIKCGNHDIRLINHIMEKAPYLLELDILSLESVLGLDALKVEFYNEEDPLVLEGDLQITHGWYARAKSGNTGHGHLEASPHRYGICGHTHKAAYISRFGRVWVETGMLGDVQKTHHYLKDKPADAAQAFTVGYLLHNDETDETYWNLQLVPVNKGTFIYNGSVY